jgi:hypothetical protein
MYQLIQLRYSVVSIVTIKGSINVRITKERRGLVLTCYVNAKKKTKTKRLTLLI